MTHYYLILWITEMVLCALGAFITARKGAQSRPMLIATVGFVIMMFGSLISILGDGIAHWFTLGPEFEDIFYLLTNMWSVGRLVGLLFVIAGVQFSFKDWRKRH